MNDRTHNLQEEEEEVRYGTINICGRALEHSSISVD